MAQTSAMDACFWLFNITLAVSTLVTVLIQRKDDAAGLVVLSQCLVSFAVVSVMTIRAATPTPFRGGDAATIYEEFEAYGYPRWFCTVIRVVKPAFAALLVIGIIYPAVLPVGAGGVMALLIGAVVSHMKVRDPLVKSVPAFTLGLLCLGMLVACTQGCAELSEDTGRFGVFATEGCRLVLFGVLGLVCAGMVAHTLGVSDILFWTLNAAVAISAVVAVLMQRKDDAAGLVVLSQCLVAFAVFSVMTIRAATPTPFRGGEAATIYEEFEAYGYPRWFCTAIRVVKPAFAALLVIGIIYPAVLPVGAGGVMVLLIGAVASHMKVRDPLVKSVPAFTLGLLCLSMLFASFSGCAKFNDELIVGARPPAVLATQMGRSIAFGVLLVICAAMVSFTISALASEKTAECRTMHEPYLKLEA